MSSPTRPGVWLPETVWLGASYIHREQFHLIYKPLITKELEFDNWWCQHCWPGLRCQVCGRPSGDLDECGPCLAASIAQDKTIERLS